MKFNRTNVIDNETKQKLMERLEGAAPEEKSAVIVEVMEQFIEQRDSALIRELQEDAEAMESGKATAEKLGLRTAFNAEEKSFLSNIQQAVTFTQDAVIPTSIVDRTLADVKATSDTLKLVNMAPAGVTKWVVGSHSGTGAWGALTGTLTSELTASLTSMNVEANKAYVLLVVPKAVRDLGLPLVDKYFSAILAEAMHDVLVDGFLNGAGINAPVGITYKLPNAEGTVAAKAVLDTVTGFSPADLATVKTTLSNGGKRPINKLYVIANPATVYQYVDPALYALSIGGQYVAASKDDIEVIAEPKLAAGKAVFTLDGVYTMGMSAIRVDEYKETKALDDADLFVGKAYANGRADDDNTAVVIDATQLVPFKFTTVVEA